MKFTAAVDIDRHINSVHLAILWKSALMGTHKNVFGVKIILPPIVTTRYCFFCAVAWLSSRLSFHKFAYLPPSVWESREMCVLCMCVIWLEKAYEKGKIVDRDCCLPFFSSISRSSERERKRKMWGLYMEMIFVLSLALHSTCNRLCVYTHFNINSETY